MWCGLIVEFYSEQRVTCLNVSPVFTSSWNSQVSSIQLAHDGDYKRNFQALLHLHVPKILLLI